ncbi:hypothetical protein [Lentisalinibacter salinarum]|uniref:hypothetical protein n=1 Tax=Lentisalinibacter salinarum TaxID=2992239 RepID=UPI00386FDD02
MPKILIAEFPANRDKVPEVEATLKEALVDTRAFDGCIRIDTYFDEAVSQSFRVRKLEPREV